MRRVDAPPVVDDYVEHAQEDDEEARRPLGLEPNSNHSACSQPKYRDKCTRNRPLSIEHKSDEKEDEEHTARELEAGQEAR